MTGAECSHDAPFTYLAECGGAVDYVIFLTMIAGILLAFPVWRYIRTDDGFVKVLKEELVSYAKITGGAFLWIGLLFVAGYAVDWAGDASRVSSEEVVDRVCEVDVEGTHVKEDTFDEGTYEAVIETELVNLHVGEYDSREEAQNAIEQTIEDCPDSNSELENSSAIEDAEVKVWGLDEVRDALGSRTSAGDGRE